MEYVKPQQTLMFTIKIALNKRVEVLPLASEKKFCTIWCPSSVGDSSSAASSSSLMNNHNHASSSASSVVTASPMRSLTSAHGGLYVSAPGKIILFGEHAVVQGKTAVAGSIDLRTYVSLFTSADGRIYLSLPDLGVEKTWMLKDLVKALDRINTECPIDGMLPPSLESGYMWAQKLANLAQDQPKSEKAGAAAGATEKAIYAFWYLLIGVMQRKSAQLKKNAHNMAPTERATFVDNAIRLHDGSDGRQNDR
uniref:DUF1115 domain-containing protein n=1 Tax=Steinernema glaseri TaxID=37863 RepID=A0A1I8A6T0_9BILA